MAYSFGAPKIVTDGLVLHLDAANHRSYPGSGTTWKDLSGNGNDGTLVNGVGYSSVNAGGMVFDGSDDYITTNFKFTGTESASIYVWCNLASSSDNEILYVQGTGTGRIWLYKASNNAFVTNTYFGPGFDFYLTGASNITEQNVLLTLTLNRTGFQKTYYNGILTNSRDISAASAIDYTTSNVGIYSFAAGIWSRGAGSVYSLMCYNKEHSAQEVLQNYNSTKARYNL